MADNTCTDPFDAFRLATEHLDKELYRRASVSSVWLDVIPRSEYMSGVGLTNSTFTIERSEPTSDEESWPAVSSMGAGDTVGDPGLATITGSSACATSWNDVKYGYTEQLYSPEQIGLRGPIICKDELIYNFEAGRFLEAYLQALAMRSEKTLSNRYWNIFMHLTPKNSANSSYTGVSGGTFDADHTPPTSPDLSSVPVPTSQLTQEMLDITAAELNRDGASNPNSSGWITLGADGPIYPLLIGQEASQAIQLNNSDFRNDYRYAEPSALLKRMGATRVIKNFRHVITLTPPRYEPGANQVLARVNTWQMVAKSKGFGAELSTGYKQAQYESACVLSPWVFHSEIIRPVNSAAGLTWDPTSYFGEWQFKTGGRDIDEQTSNAVCYDPLHKLGRHFAEYKHAARPIFPQFGRTIYYKRCPTSSFSLVTCAGVS